MLNRVFYTFYCIKQSKNKFFFKKRKKRKKYTQKKVSQIYQKNIVFKHFLEKKKLYSELDENDFS